MKFFALCAVLASTIGFSQCFQLDPHRVNVIEDRILGGSTAKPGQLPYMVSLRNLTNSHACGGGLISNRWIVTAAHCCQGNFSNPDNLVAYVGAHHISNDGRMHRLDRINNHPSYNKTTKRGDISLLHTVDVVRFNDRVKPIPLGQQFVIGGKTSVVSGWGVYERGLDPIFPTHLQVVTLSTLTNKECVSKFPEERLHRYLYAGTLCVGSEWGKGTCGLDSGGPLASNGRLIGVVSWGVPCAVGRPDVFTRISEFTLWIQIVTGVVAVQ